jgi:hypothetical protein
MVSHISRDVERGALLCRRNNSGGAAAAHQGNSAVASRVSDHGDYGAAKIVTDPAQDALGGQRFRGFGDDAESSTLVLLGWQERTQRLQPEMAS